MKVSLVLLLAVGCHFTSGEQQRVIPQITEGPYQNYSGRALTELGGRMYYFETSITTSWTAAKNFCRSINMFLVSVETSEENQLILDYIFSSTGIKNFWTSGNDYGRDQGDYIWDSTGRPVIFTAFHPDEPNFKSGEHYINYYNKNGLLLWNDEKDVTENLVYAICEQAD